MVLFGINESVRNARKKEQVEGLKGEARGEGVRKKVLALGGEIKEYQPYCIRFCPRQVAKISARMIVTVYRVNCATVVDSEVCKIWRPGSPICVRPALRPLGELLLHLWSRPTLAIVVVVKAEAEAGWGVIVLVVIKGSKWRVCLMCLAMGGTEEVV